MEVAGSHPVRVLSPEMLSLWECAEVLFINAGHARRRVNGERCRGAPGGGVRFELHTMSRW